MVMNLKAAGFDVAFSPIYHAFAQGFNKSMNISKKLDERLGMERTEGRDIVYADGKVRPNLYSTDGSNDGWKRPSHLNYTGNRQLTIPASPEAQALDGAYSSFQPKPAVEVILCVQKPQTAKYKRSDVYRILNAKYDYWYTQHTEVKEPGENSKGNIDKLSKKWATELSQAGYSLKDGDVIERRLALHPALEDEVIVNRSVVLWSAPFKDSDVTSSITHALDSGKGVTWLDDVRIPHNEQILCHEGKSGFADGYNGQGRQYTVQARFPANILVSDDVLNDGVERKTHSTGRHDLSEYRNGRIRGGFLPMARSPGVQYGSNTGSFSRYFSLDQWAQEHLPESILKTFPFLLVPKPSKNEKTAGGRVENTHPTVKAVKLMSYLITMGSRPGDLVLDPYIGSGTTGAAAILKKRRIVGCEIEEESCIIAMKRMEWATRQMDSEKEAEEVRQLSFF